LALPEASRIPWRWVHRLMVGVQHSEAMASWPSSRGSEGVPSPSGGIALRLQHRKGTRCPHYIVATTWNAPGDRGLEGPIAQPASANICTAATGTNSQANVASSVQPVRGPSLGSRTSTPMQASSPRSPRAKRSAALRVVEGQSSLIGSGSPSRSPHRCGSQGGSVHKRGRTRVHRRRRLPQLPQPGQGRVREPMVGRRDSSVGTPWTDQTVRRVSDELALMICADVVVQERECSCPTVGFGPAFVNRLRGLPVGVLEEDVHGAGPREVGGAVELGGTADRDVGSDADDGAIVSLKAGDLRGHGLGPVCGQFLVGGLIRCGARSRHRSLSENTTVARCNARQPLHLAVEVTKAACSQLDVCIGPCINLLMRNNQIGRYERIRKQSKGESYSERDSSVVSELGLTTAHCYGYRREIQHFQSSCKLSADQNGRIRNRRETVGGRISSSILGRTRLAADLSPSRFSNPVNLSRRTNLSGVQIALIDKLLQPFVNSLLRHVHQIRYFSGRHYRVRRQSNVFQDLLVGDLGRRPSHRVHFFLLCVKGWAVVISSYASIVSAEQLSGSENIETTYDTTRAESVPTRTAPPGVQPGRRPVGSLCRTTMTTRERTDDKSTVPRPNEAQTHCQYDGCTHVEQFHNGALAQSAAHDHVDNTGRDVTVDAPEWSRPLTVVGTIQTHGGAE